MNTNDKQQSIKLVFCTPFNQDYYSIGVNSIDKLEMIDRQELIVFITKLHKDLYTEVYEHSRRFHTFIVSIEEGTLTELNPDNSTFEEEALKLINDPLNFKDRNEEKPDPSAKAMNMANKLKKTLFDKLM